MKTPKIWKDDAFRGATYGLGGTLVASAIISGVKYLFSSEEEEYDTDEEAEDFYKDMEEVYAEEGPGGLVDWLLENDEDIEGKKDAKKYVKEFEDENPRIVKRYARAQKRAESATA